MSIDNEDGIGKVKGKVSAYQTVIENKDVESKKQKETSRQKIDKKKSETTKQVKELKEKNKKLQNKIKTNQTDLFDQLLDLYKTTLQTKNKDNKNKDDKKGLSTVQNSQSVAMLGNIFMMAVENTKNKISEILVDEIITTIGCSEEQSYENVVNVDLYVKLKHIDLFKILQVSFDDEYGKYNYERSTTTNGQIPYSMNRELYNRLISPQSFQQQYGQSYIGASSAQLMDIQYVDNYVNPVTNLPEYGDFFKITLLNQVSGKTKVSDFLRDYFMSIDVFSLDSLIQNVLSELFGAIDFAMGKPLEDLTEIAKFIKFMKRIMGICSDPAKKIDISGSGKFSDLDLIDDSFFEISPQELRIIEEKGEKTVNGLVTFEDCDSVNLPLNVQATTQILDDVIKENKAQDKVNLFFNGIDNLTNDPKWGGLLGPDVNINGSVITDLLSKLPMILVKTILSPKVMLGFMIMIKATITSGGSFLDLLFENITEFFKKFKKFVVNFGRKIISIFIAEIFSLLKKNISHLVESILLDIVKETKNKQLSMYSTIIYILMIAGEAFIDYRNCKSIIDELLKLLNLGISKLNLGLPMFALAGAQFLGGVSDTRSLANTIENLQKAGLPTDANADGSPNLMNVAMSSMIKGQNKEQAENGKTEVYIPPLTVFVPPFGAGPGTTKPVKSYGKSY